MEIINEIQTDRSNLRRRASALLRPWKHYKIGITNDYGRRAYQYGDTYEKMIVLYETNVSDTAAPSWSAVAVEVR